jgi:tRNA(Ile)-lysidine synthase
VPPGIQCCLADNSLYITKKKKLNYDIEMEVPGETFVEAAGVRFQSSILKSAPEEIKVPRRTQNVIVDFAKITGKLKVRNIKTGDRFRPLGLGGTKKVGDYLTDRKVVPVIRDEIPVVLDDNGIVWLAGFEIDDRVKVNGNTKEALKIELVHVS